jgi:cytidine deaminase
MPYIFCVLGKHAHTPFLPCTECKENIFELMHLDLVKANVISFEEGKYMLMFMDDARSRKYGSISVSNIWVR